MATVDLVAVQVNATAAEPLAASAASTASAASAAVVREAGAVELLLKVARAAIGPDQAGPASKAANATATMTATRHM